MSNSKQQDVNQPFIVNIVVVLAILVGGFYIFSAMTPDEKYRIIEYLFQNVRFETQLKQVMTSLSSFLEKLDPDMRYYALLLTVKAALFTEVIPLLIFASVLAAVDVKIQVSDIFDVRVPSVTSFHSARKLIPVFWLFFPVCYIALPVEYYFHDIHCRTILYVLGTVNAVLIYRVHYVMRMNRPPLM